MKKFLFVFFAIFISLRLTAQDTYRCFQPQKPFTDQQLKQRLVFEQKIQNYLNTSFRTDGAVVMIPLVVHIVYKLPRHYISKEQVLSQIDVLNKDFNRTNSDTSKTPSIFKQLASSPEFQFKLAVRHPTGIPTDGITYTKTIVDSFSDNDNVKDSNKGGHDAWDPKQYLNIWVCNLDGSNLGYFPYDYAATAGNSNDGVVVTYRAFGTFGNFLSPIYNLGRTTTHEIGHYFGLYHPWGPPLRPACSSDEVNDTPPQSSDTKGCPAVSPYIDPECNNEPLGRNFSNFMDYTNDACMNMFTKGQSERMKATLNINRSSLLTSKALDPPFDNDLSISFILDSTNFCSGKDLYPKVRISNYGKDTVKAYSFSVTVNGNIYQYNYSGNLLSLKDTVWALNDILISSEKINFKADISFILPIKDGYTANNSHSFEFTCSEPLCLYPNPADDAVYIKGNTPKVNSITIFNLSGAELLKVVKGAKIDVSSLSPGFYLIILETDEKAVRKQLLVLR